jgi:mRNA interferase MazF
MEIRKWHVYLADLSPRRGTEPGKVRPVVVVQTDLLNGVHPSTVVCPLTSNVRREAEALRVHLMMGEAGLTRPSDVMVDQIRAIDNRRLRRPMGKIHRRSQIKLALNLSILLA